MEHATEEQKSQGWLPLPETKLQEKWELSTWVDTKEVQGDEERHDRLLRKRMKMSERKDGVYGPDRLNNKGGKEEADAYYMPMTPLPESQGNFGRKLKEN